MSIQRPYPHARAHNGLETMHLAVPLHTLQVPAMKMFLEREEEPEELDFSRQ